MTKLKIIRRILMNSNLNPHSDETRQYTVQQTIRKPNNLICYDTVQLNSKIK